MPATAAPATRSRKKSASRAAEDSFDAIVIGTGMGGSACGAILAKHGFRTLILEKNPRVGGSCSWYEKDGFRIDMGTHMFIRGNKGPFGVCTKRLGMGTPIEFRRTRDIAWVRGFNIDARMPSDPRRLPVFALQVLVQSGLPLTALPSIIRMFRDIVTMPQDRIEYWDTRTIDEFMSVYTKDPFVHTLIGFLLGLYFILPTWQASAGESIWNLQHFLRDNSLSYPKGGSAIIPQTFLKGAEAHGAQVMTMAGVEKILVEDGKATGVIARGNRTFRAPVVISTSSMQDTMFRMVGKEYLSEAYAKRVQAIKGSYIAVQAKIGLKKGVTRAGCICGGYPRKIDRNQMNHETMIETFRQLESGKVAPFTPIYCPIPTNFDPGLAPPGMQLLTACAVAPTTDVELDDGPKKWIDNMLTAVYDMVPGSREQVVFEDTFSVQAIASWIGKSSGAAVTTGQTPDQVGKNRPGHRTPIRGLYMCGDAAGSRGVGTELACQSGMECADLIADERRNFLI
ncbi:MAG: NAD(P)/FAD-dependent oxidoreductase [Deltaproteobacteria bacterium]|nr:NAD(P)/FAD-dependent oxidoreductase [Deltaproteobacteria bacterium]